MERDAIVKRSTGSATHAPAQLSDLLLSWLWSLKNSGPGSFENLTAELLSATAGVPFRVAGAGEQRGEDASTSAEAGSFIKVEAKKYSRSRLGKAAVTAKFAQAAAAAPDLDLWVLATTVPLHSQAQDELTILAERLGVWTETLDAKPGQPHPLLVLCAANPRIAERYLPAHAARRRPLVAGLERLRRSPGFSQLLESLQERFRSPQIGFALSRDWSNGRLNAALHDAEESRAKLAEAIVPLNSAVVLVPRTSVLGRLSAWWRGKESVQGLGVVLGEERCGKSWAVAAWMGHYLLRERDAPLILWVPSRDFDQETAARESIRETILRYLVPRLQEYSRRSSEFWRRRLEQWLGKQSPGTPRVLLYVDGLHEPANPAASRRFLARARSGLGHPANPGLAVLIASRTAFWESLEDAAPIEEPLIRDGSAPGIRDQRPTHRFPVGAFEDAELREARLTLEQRELLSDPSLSRFFKQPRYFQILLRLGPRLAASGDITAARLFFEDWRERLTSTMGRPFSEEEFHERLKDFAAGSNRSPSGRYEAVVGAPNPSDPEFVKVFQELAMGGVLEPLPSQPRRFRVKEEPLYLGLGLHLLADLERDSAAGIAATRARLEAALEPGPNLEENARILASALVAAFRSRGPHSASHACQRLLLEALVTHPNGMDVWVRFKPWIYFEDHPRPFQECAEAFWSRPPADFNARERMSYGLVCLVENGPPPLKLVGVCENWLARVAPEHGATDPESELELGRGLIEESGETDLKLESGPEAADPAALALQLIGAAEDPIPFARSLELWALSAAASHHARYRVEVWWILRRSPPELLDRLTSRATHWARSPARLHRKAALLLLRCIASEAALHLVDALERELEAGWRELKVRHRGAWSVHTVRGRKRAPISTIKHLGAKLARVAVVPSFRIPDEWKAALRKELSELPSESIDAGYQRTEAELWLEESEAAFLAFVPEDLVRLRRRIARRNLTSPDHRPRLDVVESDFLLLTRAHLGLIRKRRSELTKDPALAEPQRHEEWHLAGLEFAATPSPAGQLRLLLSRREAFDNADWGPLRAKAERSVVRHWLGRLRGERGLRAKRIAWMLAAQDLEALNATDGLDERLLPALESEEVGTIAEDFVLRGKKPALLRAAYAQRLLSAEAIAHAASGAWSSEVFRDVDLEDACEKNVGLASWYLRSRPDSLAALRSWTSMLRATLEAREARHDATVQVSVDILARALQQLPEECTTWIRTLTDRQSPHARRMRHVHSTFVGTAARALFLLDDARASALFRAWREEPNVPRAVTEIGIERSYLVPFAAGPTPTAQRAADAMFREALTDWELSSVVLAAEHWGWHSWLSDQIQSSLGADDARTIARGMSAWGLCVSPGRLAFRENSLPVFGGGWLKAVRDVATERQRRRRASAYWFRKFIASDSDEEAWRSFRLFLKTVDARYLVWFGLNRSLRQAPSDRFQRWAHLFLNWRSLERMLDESRRRYEETLYGHSLPGKEQPPWKRAWYV